LNHEQIEAMVAVLRDSPALTEIELRSGAASLRLRRPAGRGRASFAFPQTAPIAAAAAEAPEGAAAKSASNGGGRAAAVTSTQTAVTVTATVVGIFHPRSGAARVAAGDAVRAGQVLGQIEAIRLLNDCIAPVAGIVSRVAIEDGQPVEYGQLLFEITPDAV
jgi:acetyl-CoA carboxylase biotin carboxyl carrier protein